MPASTLAIIGGGASGVVAAIQLLRQGDDRRRLIVIVGGRGAPGRGVAYGSRHAAHLLNVRAGRMSALPDDAGHFVRWLQARRPDHGYDARSFAPRESFGRYLEDTLEEARRQAPASVSLEWLAARATDVAVGPGGVRVEVEGREPLVADRVVLAIGDSTGPARLPGVVDPWAPHAFSGLDPLRPVLVLGTGLTMIDVALALWAEGHVGGVWAVSRHGLLPREQSAGASAACHGRLPERLPASVRECLAAIREAIEAAAAEGCAWHCVMEALRGLTAGHWQALSLDEKRRFLRHVRPYWDVHRHRIAPSVAAEVARLKERGYLRVQAGRLEALRPTLDGVHAIIAPRGSGGTGGCRLVVQRAFDARGTGYGGEGDLVRRLRERKLLRPHATGIGWDVTADGALVSAEGRPSIHLWTLGAPRRGVLWESTAIPEIRAQAQELAERLTARTIEWHAASAR